MQHVGNVKSCFSCQNIKGPRREQLKEISWASKTLVQIFTSHEFTITNFLELYSTEIADPVLDYATGAVLLPYQLQTMLCPLTIHT